MKYWKELPSGEAVPGDWDDFVRSSESQSRRVAWDDLGNGITVSTVFLALDHSFGTGPPLLYETMVFSGDASRGQWRYHAREAAEIGHRQVVQAIIDRVDLDTLYVAP